MSQTNRSNLNDKSCVAQSTRKVEPSLLADAARMLASELYKMLYRLQQCQFEGQSSP